MELLVISKSANAVHGAKSCRSFASAAKQISDITDRGLEAYTFVWDARKGTTRNLTPTEYKMLQQAEYV